MKPSQQKALLQRLMMQETEKIRKQVAQQVYAVMLKNLHDRHGFTPQQLIDVFEQSVADFDCINGKYATIEDFYELLGEMGIKIK